MSRKKTKTKIKILSSILTVICLILLYYLSPLFSEPSIIHAPSKEVQEALNLQNEKFNLLFLNVGQADSTFLYLNGVSMLIDGGNNSDGPLIVEFLKSQKIDTIDYIIGTHLDEDHIGGLDEIIDAFSVQNVFLPQHTDTDNAYYHAVEIATQKQEKEIEQVEIGDTFPFDTASFEILSVQNNASTSKNDSSIVLEMHYQEQKFLFMGDASSKVENKFKWEPVTVLKVGHHGSGSSSSSSFLNQIRPQYSIISSGKGNNYGHPKQEVLNRLNEIGSTIYRTDEKGTIWLKSNGEELEITFLDINLDGASKKVSALNYFYWYDIRKKNIEICSYFML